MSDASCDPPAPFPQGGRAKMEVDDPRRSRLREHLQTLRVKHDKCILQEPTLKDAHIYCVLHHISAQQFGPLIERYIITKYHYTKNRASDCTGDCSKEDGKHVEIKASLGGSSHSKFNYVQIRLSQDVSLYLFTAYHLTMENVERGGDLYIFLIPKESMIDLIMEHGGYAHGTIREHGVITMDSLLNAEKTHEYSLRPVFGDACWNGLLLFQTEEENL